MHLKVNTTKTSLIMKARYKRLRKEVTEVGVHGYMWFVFLIWILPTSIWLPIQGYAFSILSEIVSEVALQSMRHGSQPKRARPAVNVHSHHLF
jgi:hypothetical protein